MDRDRAVPTAPVSRGPRSFTAIVTLPYQHLERATTGLRAELQRQLMAADLHAVPVWDSFTVTGPREFADLRGRSWYEYRATVQAHGPFELPGLGAASR